MGDRLKNKVAVVTGSGRGIGRAIAKAMAQEGARLVIVDLKPGIEGGDADGTAAEIVKMGGKAVVVYGDVSKFSVGRQIAEVALSQFARIDILVNNAGFYNLTDPWETKEEEWDRVTDVILKGTFNCTRHVLPAMKNQRWGRIINCTSGYWLGGSQAIHFAAAKAGVVGFTRALAVDVANLGITCNAYHPLAASVSRTGKPPIEHVAEVAKKRLELGLITKAEYEIAVNPPSAEGIGPMITYLATDAASGINGHVFYTSHNRFGIYSEPVKKKMLIKEQGLWTVDELIEQVPKVLLANS